MTENSGQKKDSAYSKVVQKGVSDDPSLSIKALANKFEVPECTMLRFVHKDFKHLSHDIEVKRMLPEGNETQKI